MRHHNGGLRFVTLAGLAVAAGCGVLSSRELQSIDAGGGAGTTGVGGRGPIIITGLGGGGGFGPNPEPNCGSKDKRAARLSPEILIVLDASGSMNDDITNMSCVDGCGAASKWAQLIPALEQVVTQTHTQVHWGLKFFASDTMCSVSPIAEVPVEPINGPLISDAIAARTSANGGVAQGSRTPTRAALDQATAYLAGVPTPNLKSILLVTDGIANCPAAGSSADDDTAGAVDAAMRSVAAGFPVFVLGIATEGVVTNGVDADAALGMLARAGGLPRAADPAYYPVANAAELTSALLTLIAVSSTCTFQVGPAPTNDGTSTVDFIDVFADGVQVPRDRTHMNGWDYTDATHNAIQIYGPTCDAVFSGAVQTVAVTFRCILGG